MFFDHVGSGRSDLSAYDTVNYGSLRGYADDVVAICRELDLHDVVFVGHSVCAMIGVLASLQAPGLFGALVMVGPAPLRRRRRLRRRVQPRRDRRPAGRTGRQPHGWSAQMAPVIMGNPDRPELATELTNSFCATDPEIARQFARVTFPSDNRKDLAGVSVPTLSSSAARSSSRPRPWGTTCTSTSAAACSPNWRATGHCPNLSAPEETTSAIRAFLQG